FVMIGSALRGTNWGHQQQQQQRGEVRRVSQNRCQSERVYADTRGLGGRGEEQRPSLTDAPVRLSLGV
ncbi:hypothetical protein Pmani_024525, partial [Petrolisthes manimaculis]